MMELKVCDDRFAVRNIAQACKVASNVKDSYDEFGGAVYQIDGIKVTLKELESLNQFAKTETIDAVPFLSERKQATAELLLETYYEQKRKTSPLFRAVEKVALSPAPASDKLKKKLEAINKWIACCDIAVETRHGNIDLISAEDREQMKIRIPTGAVNQLGKLTETRAKLANITALSYEFY